MKLPSSPSLKYVTSPMISAFWIHSCDLFDFRGSSRGQIRVFRCGWSARISCWLWSCYGPTGPGSGDDDDDEDDDDYDYDDDLMKQMMMAMTCSDMWWSHALKTTNIYRITSERLVTINRFFKFGQQLKWSSSLKPLHPFLRFLHLMNLSGLQLVQYHRFGFKLPIDYNILC